MSLLVPSTPRTSRITGGVTDRSTSNNASIAGDGIIGVASLTEISRRSCLLVNIGNSRLL